MKVRFKSFFILILALLLFNFFTSFSFADVSCPTSNIQCGELDNAGGCAAPCERVVTSIVPRGPSWCACVENNTPPGTLSCGETCVNTGDCGSECPYCRYDHAAGSQTCQTEVVPPGDNWFAGEELCGGSGIETAIGCIPVGETGSMTEYLLKWAMGLGGGIAFVLMVYAGFMIITGSGNPQRVQAGKELMTAAVSGLLMIIFSVFLLRFLGVDVLGIPGL